MKHNLRAAAVASGLALLGVVSVGAPATADSTINVTTTADDDPFVPNGDCSLREAVISANNDFSPSGDCADGSGNDTIVLQPGELYPLTIGDAFADPIDCNPETGDLDVCEDGGNGGGLGASAAVPPEKFAARTERTASWDAAATT